MPANKCILIKTGLLTGLLFLGFYNLHMARGQMPPQRNLPALEWFAFGGIGFAGMPSKGQIEFEKVIKAPDAIEQLENWYANGSDILRAYALVGLYRLAPLRYQQFKAQIQVQNKMADTFAEIIGCSVGTRTYQSLFDKIENGAYDRYLKSAVVAPLPAANQP